VSRRWRVVAALAVGLILLALSLWGVDVAEVRRNVAAAKPGWLLAGAPIYLLSYFVRSLRWRLVLRPVERVTVAESYSMLMAGYFLNYVIPVRAGEIAKSFFLKRLKGTPIATSLPTVFVDKLLEFVSILLIVLMVPVLSIRLEGPVAVLIFTLLGIFLVALCLLAVAFRRRDETTRLLCWMIRWLPRGLYERLSVWIAMFVKGMGVARENVKALPSLIALTAVAVLLDAAYFLMMFRAFSVDVGFAKVIFGYTLLTLSYILPTPPAQIGYNELVIGLIFAGGLTGAHVGRGDVMAVVIVAHAMTGILITAVGLLSFWSMGIRVSESFRGMGSAAGSEISAEDGVIAGTDGERLRGGSEI
jgi:uncharacterized protein (TIRG00374 family)